MTRNQMLWAQQHDWFVDARESDTKDIGIDSNWEVCAVCEAVKADGEVVRTAFITSDYARLRRWAGY